MPPDSVAKTSAVAVSHFTFQDNRMGSGCSQSLAFHGRQCGLHRFSLIAAAADWGSSHTWRRRPGTDRPISLSLCMTEVQATLESRLRAMGCNPTMLETDADLENLCALADSTLYSERSGARA